MEKQVSIIAEMHRSDLNIGNLVEITLKDGAEWDNGWSPAPTVDPQGYRAPRGETLPAIPGLRTVGYIAEYKTDRLTLAPAWGNMEQSRPGPRFEAGSCYVHENAILSYRRL